MDDDEDFALGPEGNDMGYYETEDLYLHMVFIEVEGPAPAGTMTEHGVPIDKRSFWGHVEVRAGDTETLAEALRIATLSLADHHRLAAEAHDALEQDVQETGGLGERALGWARDVVRQVTVTGAAAAIVKILLAYLGHVT